MSDNSILAERHYLDLNVPLSDCRLISVSPKVYRFLFRLNMRNTGKLGLRLLGRKWIMCDHEGHTYIIEADHIFGQDPLLLPNAVFSFGGFHDFPEIPKSLELRIFGIDQMLTPFISQPCVFNKRHFRISA